MLAGSTRPVVRKGVSGSARRIGVELNNEWSTRAIREVRIEGSVPYDSIQLHEQGKGTANTALRSTGEVGERVHMKRSEACSTTVHLIHPERTIDRR